MKIESDGLIVLSDSCEQVHTAASSSQYANISTIHLMTVSIENNTITLENGAISLENSAVHYITTVTVV